MTTTTTTPSFTVGQWVRSAAVGKAPPFNGQIVAWTPGIYIVRDDTNRRFARTADELELLQ
jgi:hypothetical protein